MLLDAADGDKGQGAGSHRVLQVAEAHRRAHVVLGLGGEQRAHADVVGAGGHRGRGLVRVVGGQADQQMRADQPAHLGHRQVVLADMHPVRIAKQGERGVVVDDEQGPGTAGEGADGPALREHLGKALVRPLLAVLDDADTAGEHLPDHLDIGAAVGEFLGGDAVDAGREVGFSLWCCHGKPPGDEVGGRSCDWPR